MITEKRLTNRSACGCFWLSLKKGGLACWDWLECIMNWFRVSTLLRGHLHDFHTILITSEILWYEMERRPTLSFSWKRGESSLLSFKLKAVPLAVSRGSQAQVTMIRYAFEGTAGQVKRGRSSDQGGVFFFYYTTIARPYWTWKFNRWKK